MVTDNNLFSRLGKWFDLSMPGADDGGPWLSDPSSHAPRWSPEFRQARNTVYWFTSNVSHAHLDTDEIIDPKVHPPS